MKLQCYESHSGILIYSQWWINFIDSIKSELQTSDNKVKLRTQRIEEFGGRLMSIDNITYIEFEQDSLATLFLLRWS